MHTGTYAENDDGHGRPSRRRYGRKELPEGQQYGPYFGVPAHEQPQGDSQGHRNAEGREKTPQAVKHMQGKVFMQQHVPESRRHRTQARQQALGHKSGLGQQFPKQEQENEQTEKARLKKIPQGVFGESAEFHWNSADSLCCVLIGDHHVKPLNSGAKRASPGFFSMVP